MLTTGFIPLGWIIQIGYVIDITLTSCHWFTQKLLNVFSIRFIDLYNTLIDIWLQFLDWLSGRFLNILFHLAKQPGDPSRPMCTALQGGSVMDQGPLHLEQKNDNINRASFWHKEIFMIGSRLPIPTKEPKTKLCKHQIILNERFTRNGRTVFN